MYLQTYGICSESDFSQNSIYSSGPHIPISNCRQRGTTMLQGSKYQSVSTENLYLIILEMSEYSFPSI